MSLKCFWILQIIQNDIKMSVKEWSWMDKPDLTNQKKWVIVRGENIFRYETFNEAVTVNQMLCGHLMSEEYYENHYKEDKK